MKDYSSIEKTFLMVKPDGIRRGLVGEIFERLERNGLKLVACRMIKATKKQVALNYPGTKEWLVNVGNKTLGNYDNDKAAVKKDVGTDDPEEIGRKVLEGITHYLTECPVILTVWEGNQSIQIVRKLVGKTDPLVSDIGSIRGDFGFDSAKLAIKDGRITFKTIVHCSDSPEEAKREIEHWFGKDYDYLGNYERVDYIDCIH